MSFYKLVSIEKGCCVMRGWKRLLGVLLAAGILLTAGCYAKEEGDEPSTGPESAARA